jgi:hypothetical protein
MMIIVPTITESQQPHNPLIAAPVICLELALAKHVADGVDTPGGMMHEEKSHKPTPKETRPATEREWDYKSKDNPEPECPADKDGDTIL